MPPTRWLTGQPDYWAMEREAHANLLREQAEIARVARENERAAAERILGLDPNAILNEKMSVDVAPVTQDIPYNPDRPERAGLQGPDVFPMADVKRRVAGIPSGPSLPTGGPMPEGPAANVTVEPGRVDEYLTPRSPSGAVLELTRQLGPALNTAGGRALLQAIERAQEKEASLAATAGQLKAGMAPKGYVNEKTGELVSFDPRTGQFTVQRPGSTKKEPIKLGKDDRLIDPETMQVLVPADVTAGSRDMKTTGAARAAEAALRFPDDPLKQAQWIQEQAEGAATRVAGATTGARQGAMREAKMVTPIGMSDYAGRTFDKTGKLVTTGTVGDAMARGDLTFKDADAAKNFSSLMEATDNLPMVEQLGVTVFQKGKSSWLSKFGRSWGEVANNYLRATQIGQALDPDAAAFFRQVDALVPVFSRLAGDPRLSDLDRQSWRGVLGSSFNTLESFKATMATIKKTAERTRQRYMSGFAVPVKSDVEIQSRNTFGPAAPSAVPVE